MRLLLVALVAVGCGGNLFVPLPARPYHNAKAEYQKCIREHPESFEDDCAVEEKIQSVELEGYKAWRWSQLRVID